MVRERWYVIAEGREIQRKPVGLRRLGQDMVAWRDQAGRVRVADDRCPHRGASLASGTVEDGCITCPFHGWRFDGDGACKRIPSNGDEPVSAQVYDTRAYAVREAHGYVWLWWGKADARQEATLPDIPWLAPLTAPGMRYSTFVSEWQSPLERCVENQLDMAHLPFVHRDTIGRGLPHRVDVELSVDGDTITFWNKDPRFPSRLTFIGPGLWCLPLGTRVIQHIAFVPIDAQRTRQYVRAYRNFLNVPLLGPFFDWVMRFYTKKIFHQDRDVVGTQPANPAPGQEKLVQADAPIAAYRRWQKRLAAEQAAADESPRSTPSRPD